MRLQDPAYTRVLLATLAETTPVSQASALQDDLRRAHIEPYAWVVNKSLLAAGTRDPFLRQRLLVSESRSIVYVDRWQRECSSYRGRRPRQLACPHSRNCRIRDPQRRRTIKPYVTTALASSGASICPD